MRQQQQHQAGGPTHPGTIRNRQLRVGCLGLLGIVAALWVLGVFYDPPARTADVGIDRVAETTPRVTIDGVSVRPDAAPMRVVVSGVVRNPSAGAVSVNLVTLVHGAPPGESEYAIGGRRDDWVTVPGRAEANFDVPMPIGGWWEDVTRAEVRAGEVRRGR